MPWTSGYGRRLTCGRSWVVIPAPYTGWTFFQINFLQNCIDVCFWKDRKKRKRGRGWRNLDFLDFLQKKFYNIVYCLNRNCLISGKISEKISRKLHNGMFAQTAMGQYKLSRFGFSCNIFSRLWNEPAFDFDLRPKKFQNLSPAKRGNLHLHSSQSFVFFWFFL